MTAYVVLDLKVTDPDAFARYRELAPAAIAAYGGRYIARGGATEIMEGSWELDRVVILEFPSLDKAKSWLESPEYREARALRQASAKTNAFVTQGL